MIESRATGEPSVSSPLTEEAQGWAVSKMTRKRPTPESWCGNAFAPGSRIDSRTAAWLISSWRIVAPTSPWKALAGDTLGNPEQYRSPTLVIVADNSLGFPS
jgi:hypothetical protein